MEEMSNTEKEKEKEKEKDIRHTTAQSQRQLIDGLIASLTQFAATPFKPNILDDVQNTQLRFVLLQKLDQAMKTLCVYDSKNSELYAWHYLYSQYTKAKIYHQRRANGPDFIVEETIPNGSIVKRYIEAKHARYTAKKRAISINFGIPTAAQQGDIQKSKAALIKSLNEKMFSGMVIITIGKGAGSQDGHCYRIMYPFCLFIVVAIWEYNTRKREARPSHSKPPIRNVNLNGQVCKTCERVHRYLYYEKCSLDLGITYEKVQMIYQNDDWDKEDCNFVSRPVNAKQ